jgi:flavorubredoxin
MNTPLPSGTRVDEIADGIHRISTAIPPEVMPGGFTFNQFLVADEDPLLFHTGPRKLFPAVRAAVEQVLPIDSLRYVSFSHYEADECGSLNDFLAVAPRAEPLCGAVAAMTSIRDVADRAPRVLADQEELALGRHTVRWLDAPHLPHAWECGHLFEASTNTLFCGDLFTQGGHQHDPVTTGDILAPALEMLGAFDYYSHTKHARSLFDKLRATDPRRLACMHGASWEGDGSALLDALAEAID